MTEADVSEVLAWSREKAHGRYVTLWAEHVSDAGERGMIRLEGWEPTRPESGPAWVRSPH